MKRVRILAPLYSTYEVFARLGFNRAALLCLGHILSIESRQAISNDFRVEDLVSVRNRLAEKLDRLTSRFEMQGVTAVEWEKTAKKYSELSDWGKAENACRNVLTQCNNQPSNWVSLANTLKEQGKLPDAENACRAALAIDEHDTSALKTLAGLLGTRSQYSEAWMACNLSLENQPDFADGHAMAGWLHLMEQDFVESAYALDRAIGLDPDCFGAFCIRVQLLMNQGSFEAAGIAAREAIRIKPWHARGYASLGFIQLTLGHLDDAEDACRKSVALDPSKAELLNGLGNVFWKKGKLEQAEIQFRHSIELDSSRAEAHKNLGVILQETGRFDEAVSCIKRAINVQPTYADAHRALAGITHHTERDEAIRAMEDLISSKKIQELDLLQLSFGLGKAFDDLKEYDKAFTYFIQGNALKRKTIEWSIDDAISNFKSIKNFYSREYCQEHLNQGFMDETPVFVVGMPRSGTSLVEQILAAHTDVFGAGELGEIAGLINSRLPDLSLDGPTCQELGEKYVHAIRSLCAGEEQRIVDKMPFNFLHVGFIKLILPRCRIIHCKRNVLDTCVSNFKSYFTQNIEFAFDLEDIGRYYRLYEDMMKHWENVFPGSMHQVELKNMVNDQEGETRRLYEFLDLPWDEKSLHFYDVKRPVRTASAQQVRKPIYRSSLESWKRYENHLEPLYRGLQQETLMPG